jgi:tetratricopeptide (TPR) repeat protein
MNWKVLGLVKSSIWPIVLIISLPLLIRGLKPNLLAISILHSPEANKIYAELYTLENNENLSTNYLKGWRLIDVQMIAESIPYLQQATRIDPERVTAWAFLGKALYDSGKKKDAINVWQFAEAGPWLFLKGQEYHLDQSWALAKEYYQLSVAVDPGFSPSHKALGDVYLYTQEDIEAAKAYQKAADTTDSLYEAQFLRGQADFFEGRYREAMTFFEKAVSLNPKNPNTYAWLGYTSYWGLHDIKAANLYFEQAIQLDPDEPQAYIWLIKILIDSGDYSQAKTWSELANHRIPNNTQLIFLSASILFDLGQTEPALVELNRLLEINPNDVAAWELKGLLLLNNYQPEEAVAAFEQAIQLSPEEGNYYLQLAKALAASGQHCRALDFLRQLEAKPGQNPTVLASAEQLEFSLIEECKPQFQEP